MSSKWKKAILKRPPSRGSCMFTFCGVKSQLLKVQALVKKVAVFSAAKSPLTKADMPCKK